MPEPVQPELLLDVYFPPEIVRRNLDGSVVIRPGRVQVERRVDEMSVRAVMTRTGYSERQVRNLCYDGTLKFRQRMRADGTPVRGAKMFILRDSVEALMIHR